MVEISTPSAGAVAAGRPKELLSIQYLRALAAGAVLVFHVCQRIHVSFGVGAAGVDVFFVISGFIMWVVTYARPPRPAEFFVRRVQRIVPLYWAVTLATAAAAIILPAAFPNMRPTPWHVLGSLLFVPHRDPGGLVYPLLVPGWTLNYEMFFYLVFAVGLAMSARRRLIFVTGGLLACVLAGRLIHSSSPLWTTYTDPLLLEFVAGLCLGAAYTARLRVNALVAGLLAVVGLSGLGANLLVPFDIDHARLLFWGLPAFLLVSGMVFLEHGRGVPRMPALLLLGDASYSIYLVHGLAVSFVMRVWDLRGAPAPLVILAGVAGGVAAGVIAHFVLERPVMAFFRRGAQGRRAGGAVAPATSPAGLADAAE